MVWYPTLHLAWFPITLFFISLLPRTTIIRPSSPYSPTLVPYLTFGVVPQQHYPYSLPQGSVLGPLLYIFYTSDIASLLTSQEMLGQLYADDVQAYQHCPASYALVTVSAMSQTMEALGSWMSSNRLRLNSHKTQFIWLGTRQ